MDSTPLTNIIQPFLDTWKNRPEYCGILITGSYANETWDEGSDIDVRIVFNNETTFHEMGECFVNGKNISFVGMSTQNYIQTFQEDLLTTSKFEIRRFVVGYILDDPFGEVQKVKSKALEFYQQPNGGFEPIDELVELLTIGRQVRVFLEMPENDLFYSMAYLDCLKSIFQYYAQFIQADIPAFIKKWSRFFESSEYRRLNYFSNFPDEKFTELFIEAVNTIDAEKVKSLYQYVVEESGGLPETNFIARFDSIKEEAGLFLINS